MDDSVKKSGLMSKTPEPQDAPGAGKGQGEPAGVTEGAPATLPLVQPPARVPDGGEKKITNRLKRARGQLDALIAAFESGATCRDVVTQLAAVSKALDRAGFLIVSTAMRDCLREPVGDQDPDAAASKDMDIEELEKLFMMLT